MGLVSMGFNPTKNKNQKFPQIMRDQAHLCSKGSKTTRNF